MKEEQKKDKKTIKEIDKVKEASYSDDIVAEYIEENEDNAIKKLREKLKKCIKEKYEYLDGWQRAKADFINARKKDEKTRKEFIVFAKEELIFDLLMTIDNFDMVYADRKAWESVDKTWRIGIEHIHSQLLKTLEKQGLKQFNPEGEMFDHARHDSVESAITDKKENDQKIIEVLQKGYELNGKIIRPAKVKVGEFKN